MTTSETTRWRGGAVMGTFAALGASAVVALRDPVPEWELRLTLWINDAPRAVGWLLYPIMQLGTVWTPLVAGLAVASVTRDRVFGSAIAVTGVATWFAAKAIKTVVERGRPLQYLAGIDVREGAGTGLGYVSGHAAVATAVAVMLADVLPSRWRPVPFALAGLVGIARIVYGVHLPVDVVGGWALGALMGLIGLGVVDVLRKRSTP